MQAIRELSLESLGYFLHPEELFSSIAIKGNGTKEDGNFILDDLNRILNSIEQSTMGTESEDDFNAFKNSITQQLFALNREARGATTEPTAKTKKAEQPTATEKKPEAAAKSDTPPADFPDAKKGVDGAWYVPDPNRPGKYLKVQ